MPEQTDQPLLSDEQINRLGIAHVDLYHGEAMRAQAGIERGTILPRGWSYMDGVFKARDIYEQARKQDKERIRELENERRWIPVAEALPEAGKLVMVWSPFDEHGCGGYGFDMIDENCDDGTTWQEHNSSYEHYVAVSGQVATIGPSETARYTHWQPLPEPPTKP